MRFLLACLALLSPVSCQEAAPPAKAPQGQAVAQKATNFPAIVAPLIDPAKLDTLKGKRAATPRLRKACYWLEMAKREGSDIGEVIDQAHALTVREDEGSKIIADSQRHDPRAAGMP